jgi:serine/threonine protein kinase/Tfp pilus assembly protein PilF
VALEPGQTLLHYRLIEKIGEGGMGVVWKAEDTRLHRHVALKFVPEELAEDAHAVDRHLREARAASALNHAHICSIHDIGECEGRRFIVMELLEGRSLQQRISGKAMKVETAVELATQIVDALAAAHAKGIIHRDIKTANIFVTESGQAKMLDFGLAKLAAGPMRGPTPDDATRTALHVTTPGAVVGTVSYMSPEQALGKELDPRSDIFSLGVVLYEMITGRRAFPGDTSAAIFDAILNRAPTAPRELNGEIPAELQRIVNKCLEKDSDLRYQSAAELRADLRCLQRDSSSSRAPVTSGHATELNGRSSRIVGVVAAVLVVTLGAVVLWKSADRDAPASGLDPESTPSKGPSIAVLPFVNASGDPEQEYFSDGLTEEIITELTRYQDLFVIARHSTSQYKGGTADVREVGAALGGVRYVLQGNVRKSGNSIRVTAELSDAGDGAQVWRNSYTRDLTVSDFFSLQDELTQQVVNAIAGSYGALSRAELAEARRNPPASLDSYDCVLRAYEYVQVHNEANHLAARDCLEGAIELDPDYPEAWAWLAYTYAEEQRHQWNTRPESYDALERALEVGEHAVGLDPANQVSHGALALVHFQLREFDRFRAKAERTIALNPNNALWLAYLGLRHCSLEDWARGLPMARKALALNPNPPPWYHQPFLFHHYREGRYEAALAEAHKLEEQDYRTPLLRAAAYGQLGRLAEARHQLSELQRFEIPDDIRQDLIERHGYAAELTDHLLEGLRKAGMEGGDKEDE